MEAKIAGFRERDQTIEDLKKMAEEMDVAGLEAAIAKAVALGIPEENYKSHNTLCSKLQNTNHVRDLMNKHKGNEAITKNLKAQLDKLQSQDPGGASKLEVKLQRLANSSNTEMMRNALREADRAEFK